MTVTLLDGGMGRELARRGAPFRQPEWSALALIEAPEHVQAVHRDFIRAGARVVTTNSYALVPFHLGEERFAADAGTLAARAGRLARAAATAAHDAGVAGVRVAGSLPPLFGSYRPDLFDAARAQEVLAPLVAGLAEHVDVWLAETQSSIVEARTIRAGLPLDGKPFWLSFTLRDDDAGGPAVLRSGESVADAAVAAVELGAAALLFNCSRPEVMGAALTEARTAVERLGAQLELGVYANAFPPQPEDATANDGLDELREDLDPVGYLAWAERWQEQGAGLIGGCCGIGPEHLEALRDRLG
ncbi:MULTISPECIES: homocysteine S-methyltransferase family protein [Arthrobacter]|uniref:Homocysteine S-methyltransferase family protein n=2 Tax=Arthrobacter TaxID=1663 RepID=A0ABU9KKW1_9MICC|nr:homocysteine S-methyltransferase family protein [Arthrobacter sp. YJM1]MDP5226763.1 homocysteine S-methyltransferase family protein [Arthrobacter sp. YJM1]